MVNLYKEITSSSEAIHGDTFREQLEDMEVLYIFQPLYDMFKGWHQEKLLVKKIVLYIVYCYSDESPKISIDGDRQIEKGNVYRSLNVPYENDNIQKSLYEGIVNLAFASVVIAASAWMEKRGQQAFQYFITLQDSYAEMQRAVLLPLIKNGGGIDYDQKQKCLEHMTATKVLIKQARAELTQNNEKLKVAHHEIKTVKERRQHVGPESFAIGKNIGAPSEQQQYP